MKIPELSLISLALAFTLAMLAFPARAAEPEARPKVQPVVPMKAEAFPLHAVRLLDGPFKRAMELDRKYLLSLDPDRLLHNFRVNAGIPSSAQPLGGWEEPKSEVRGHFVGHYMSACALMYAETGDEQLKERGDKIVAGLAECQTKLGSGYLSAFPEEFIDRVEAQKPVWAPYYTLHKILAGLLDMYVYCGNRQALETARKFGDWFIARNARLSDEQMQRMLGNEHGGVNEGLANLYALTGERKYLQISLRFNHMAVLGPASRQEDRLTGLHANTQIPKFIGTARQYELTGEGWLKTASSFFWNTVVRERSYVIGGHSDGEAFTPKERLSQSLGPNTTETCNTYNMLKLTRHIFEWEPKAEYADYYERALYNHILASQNPETGMMCYYVPLRSGSHKVYNTPTDSFWCCTGTGVENHAKYGDSIYFHDGTGTLYVNLFIASELDWKETGITLRQETNYPDEQSTRLVFTCRRPTSLSLRVRHPFWAVSGFAIRVNGRKAVTASGPGSYAVITRRWKTGDTVQVSMPFTLRVEGFRDNPNRFAFLYGPLVLCAEVKAGKPFPAVVAEEGKMLAGFKPSVGKPNTFSCSSGVFRIAGETDSPVVTLEPFYKMQGSRRYEVYFDRFGEAAWQAKEEEYRAEQERRRELEARSVDFVTPGDEQNERDHRLQGDRTNSGDFSDRRYRHAVDGGWFGYALKVLPDAPQELWVTYWGSDSGGRDFDILVDGEKIATERLVGRKPGQFFDAVYPLPEELTRGKKSVTVRFQAHPGNFAGGIFGLRVMRKGAGRRRYSPLPTACDVTEAAR
jgi:DUF1680 family protein